MLGERVCVLLPDLNLATTTDDTNTEVGKEVVSGVRVVVYTTVEHGSSILSDTRLDDCLSSWMIGDKVGNVVNNTSDGNESLSVLSLLLVFLEAHDWERLQWNTPVELLAGLVDLLLLLLETSLLNFVGSEGLEVVGHSDLLHGPDEPLGWVVLVPLDGVTVVGWELVVEVVVTLSESNEGGNDVIPWAVTVIEWLITEPVSEGVDAEGSLLDEEDAEDAGVDESTQEITPEKTGNDRWENETHEQDDVEVVLVLPDDDWVLVEIGDIGTSNTLWVLLHDHPSNVRVPETLLDRVGILVGVGVSVMGTMIARPPTDRSLNGSSTNQSEEKFEWSTCGVRGVGPETMVTSGNTQSSGEVVAYCPDGSLCLKRCECGSIQTGYGDHDDQVDVEPVDMLIPVTPCYRLLKQRVSKQPLMETSRGW